MRNFPLSSLAVFIVSLPFAIACSGDDDPPPGGTAGTGGTTGGSAGVGGSTAGAGAGGTAGAATGGTAGAGTGGATGGAGAGGATGGAGTGGATGGAGAGGGSGTMDWPADTSQAGLEAFFDALAYKGADWLPNMPAAAAGDSLHGTTQIWYNKTLRTSYAAGKGLSSNPHDSGSMTVKEIYTGTAVTGHAAMLRQGTAWIYYCKASTAGACTASSMPNVASYAMTVGSCSCHGAGTINSQAQIPPP